MKTVLAGTLFTDGELHKAMQLYRQPDPDLSFAKRACQEIVLPVMDRINAATRQENDPMYLAYALEYLCSQNVKRGN